MAKPKPDKKKNEKELAVHLVATMMEEERCTEKKTIRKEAKKNATTRSQKTKKTFLRVGTFHVFSLFNQIMITFLLK